MSVAVLTRPGHYAAKRIFDLGVASLMLLVVAPLMLTIAAAIKLTSTGPVFFSQERIGLLGRRFFCVKFRTMRTHADDRLHRAYVQAWIGKNAPAQGGIFKLTRDPRIFPVGRILRRFSLDELPQLFNVLRGEMSLIGPRPALPYEVARYHRRHLRRLEAPPGLTGLWQVSGRNRLSFEQMVALDIEYLENWSFGRDLEILWRTVGVVLFEPAY